jgi:hypothetical protein
MQLSPRVSVRANAGYRATTMSPSIKFNGAEQTVPATYAGKEDGVLGGLSLLFTY